MNFLDMKLLCVECARAFPSGPWPSLSIQQRVGCKRNAAPDQGFTMAFLTASCALPKKRVLKHCTKVMVLQLCAPL